MHTIIFPPETETELEKREKPVAKPRIIFVVPQFEALEQFKPFPVCLN
jgi:hypothetical protein